MLFIILITLLIFFIVPSLILLFIYTFKKNIFLNFSQSIFFKFNKIYYSEQNKIFNLHRLVFLPHPFLNWSLNPNYKNIYGQLVHTKEGFRKTLPYDSIIEYNWNFVFLKPSLV